MAFSVRNRAVEEKARAFAAEHKISLTGGLELAIDTANSFKQRSREEEFERAMEDVRAIQAAYAALPSSGLTEQDIMGWDENGLPT